jgi:hypothetical protein
MSLRKASRSKGIPASMLAFDCVLYMRFESGTAALIEAGKASKALVSSDLELSASPSCSSASAVGKAEEHGTASSTLSSAAPWTAKGDLAPVDRCGPARWLRVGSGATEVWVDEPDGVAVSICTSTAC